MDLAYLQSIGLKIFGLPEPSTAAVGAAEAREPGAASAAPQAGARGAKAQKQKPPKEALTAEAAAAQATKAAAKLQKRRALEMSQSLSMLLRHKAREVGVPIDQFGWVLLEDALGWLNSFEGDEALEGGWPASTEEVRSVVCGSDKQRFQLWEGPTLQIRANQGHSMEGIEVETEPLNSEEVPLAVHGTYYPAWELIRSSGLRRMERNHIHLARDLPGASGVISGMRSSCEVLIWVDVRRAEATGITFHVSRNGVILTEGIQGAIGPELFHQVLDRKTGAALDAGR